MALNKEYDIGISNRVLNLLEEKKAKKVELANFIGATPSGIGDILNGKSPWRAQYIAKTAEYLSVHTDFLFFGDDEYIEKYLEAQNKKLVDLALRISESKNHYNTNKLISEFERNMQTEVKKIKRTKK